MQSLSMAFLSATKTIPATFCNQEITQLMILNKTKRVEGVFYLICKFVNRIVDCFQCMVWKQIRRVNRFCPYSQLKLLWSSLSNWTRVPLRTLQTSSQHSPWVNRKWIFFKFFRLMALHVVLSLNNWSLVVNDHIVISRMPKWNKTTKCLQHTLINNNNNKIERTTSPLSSSKFMFAVQLFSKNNNFHHQCSSY